MEDFIQNEEEFGCISCHRQNKKHQLETPTLGDALESDGSAGNKIYSSFSLHGIQYRIGDGVYLSPEAFNFKVKPCDDSKKTAKKMEDEYDEDKYPEYYRKSSDYIKGSNTDVPQPFRICKN